MSLHPSFESFQTIAQWCLSFFKGDSLSYAMFIFKVTTHEAGTHVRGHCVEVCNDCNPTIQDCFITSKNSSKFLSFRLKRIFDTNELSLEVIVFAMVICFCKPNAFFIQIYRSLLRLISCFCTWWWWQAKGHPMQNNWMWKCWNICNRRGTGHLRREWNL